MTITRTPFDIGLAMVVVLIAAMSSALIASPSPTAVLPALEVTQQQDLMDPVKLGHGMAALRRLAYLPDSSTPNGTRVLTDSVAADSLLFISAGRLKQIEAGTVMARWAELDSMQLLYSRIIKRNFGPTFLSYMSMYLTGSGTLPLIITQPTNLSAIPFMIDSVTLDSAIADMLRGTRGRHAGRWSGRFPCPSVCKRANMGEMARADSLFQAGNHTLAILTYRMIQAR